VLGAVKWGLVKQFLCESFFYSFFALFLAMSLTEFALPIMSSIVGYELSLNFLNMPWLIPALLGITLFVGFAAGSYPAFYLAAFQPARILKGGVRTGKKNTLFRSVLVVLQFAASVTLIIGTVIIIRQLAYMKNKNPGFNKEQVVVLPFRDEELRKSLSTIKTELKGQSGIIHVAVSSDIPGQYPQLNSKHPEGFPSNQPPLMYDLNVDEDFIRTMGMEIITGRDFSQEFGADKKAAIINETAAKQFGWDNPIGKRIGGYSGIKTVIGVVRDYHQLPLTQEMKPLYIRISPEDKYNPYRMLSVRIAPGGISSTLNIIETKWNEIYPNHPFDYFFLDESFGEQFQEIERTKILSSYFAGLAIFIACLGLYGLASFMTEQRTKEIGIRKVLGATTSKIVYLISKDLVKMVALANAIAWPVAYLLMRNWLSAFPYRVNITVLTFLFSGIVVLIIGLATVSYQSIKVAVANPANSLRYE